jgi:hypothetical protein
METAVGRAESRRRVAAADAISWWWCLEHSAVEEGAGCSSLVRLGPYDTSAKAACALIRVRARSREQEVRDAADEAYPRRT